MSAAPVIYGSSNEMARDGSIEIFDLRQNGKVIVAIIYPKPMSEEFLGGVGSGHKDDDLRTWYARGTVRLEGDESNEALPIAWNYSTSTRKLVFNAGPVRILVKMRKMRQSVCFLL